MYQSQQNLGTRQKFSRRYWASFVGTPDYETLFVGLYAAEYKGVLEHDIPRPHVDGVDIAGSLDVYELRLEEVLSDLIGRLLPDWGEGFRAWVQYADRQNKPIKELRATFKERDFPGFLNFRESLSRLSKLPKDWCVAFRSSKGIYLLTCPKTNEQYVGSATGQDGFWERWVEYAETGHGGNLALKSRHPSDYQVTILEVAGTACTKDEILEMERRWKNKLQSKKMGLNRN